MCQPKPWRDGKATTKFEDTCNVSRLAELFSNLAEQARGQPENARFHVATRLPAPIRSRKPANFHVPSNGFGSTIGQPISQTGRLGARVDMMSVLSEAGPTPQPGGREENGSCSA
jgi:hypothetical protein